MLVVVKRRGSELVGTEKRQAQRSHGIYDKESATNSLSPSLFSSANVGDDLHGLCTFPRPPRCLTVSCPLPCARSLLVLNVLAHLPRNGTNSERPPDGTRSHLTDSKRSCGRLGALLRFHHRGYTMVAVQREEDMGERGTHRL